MDNTIAELKQKIQDKENIPITHQRLIFTGKLMNDNATVRDYELHLEGPIHLIRKHTSTQI